MFILYFIKYEKTIDIYGYVFFDERYYIKIDAYESDIEKITKNNILVIDKYKYNYKVKNISEELLIDTSFENYKEVTIILEEKRKYINNEVVHIKINIGNERILIMLMNYLLGKE